MVAQQNGSAVCKYMAVTQQLQIKKEPHAAQKPHPKPSCSLPQPQTLQCHRHHIKSGQIRPPWPQLRRAPAVLGFATTPASTFVSPRTGSLPSPLKSVALAQFTTMTKAGPRTTSRRRHSGGLWSLPCTRRLDYIAYFLRRGAGEVVEVEEGHIVAAPPASTGGRRRC